MKEYRLALDVGFNFTVHANSPEEAMEQAKRVLQELENETEPTAKREHINTHFGSSDDSVPGINLNRIDGCFYVETRHLESAQIEDETEVQ